MKKFQAGECWLFSEGLAAVMIKNKWGFIDRQGNTAIEPQFSGAFGFSEGLAAVCVNDKYGFIDKTGQMVIEPQYDLALAFTEGVAGVLVGDNVHIIDTKGTILASPSENVTDVENFSCGLAIAECVCGENDWCSGFIDHSGKMVIEPVFCMAFAFEDGLALVSDKDGKCGFIDTAGRYVIEPQFDEAEFFCEGVAPVKKEGRWCFIDRNGAEVAILDSKFDYVFQLTEERATVKIGDKFGAIDKMGNLIIDAHFDRLNPFSEGLAYARVGDTHGWINPSGSFVIQRPMAKPTLIDRLMKRADRLRW